MKGKRCLYPRICLLLLAKLCEQKNQSLKMSENHAIYIGFHAYAGLYYNLLSVAITPVSARLLPVPFSVVGTIIKETGTGL